MHLEPFVPLDMELQISVQSQRPIRYRASSSASNTSERLGWLTDTAHVVHARSQGSGPDTDLTVLLGSSSDSQSHVYTHALQLLESLRASPSCNRLAASTLIHSCQSIDSSTSETEESQEDLKSVYAAQLAICEIKDAGSKPPATCDPFLPDKHSGVSGKLAHSSDQNGGVASALRRKLGLCLQSLESRPQHWTSYSNNRQNAVVMCQAARIHIDKGT